MTIWDSSQGWEKALSTIYKAVITGPFCVMFEAKPCTGVVYRGNWCTGWGKENPLPKFHWGGSCNGSSDGINRGHIDKITNNILLSF
jgi:hypothetical protein